jgi:predicted HicB family RNase H-like nuclease
MNDTMGYKGFTARVEFDDDDGIFIGRVLEMSDAISFHANSVADLRREFQVSIDDYLAYCAETGKGQKRHPVGSGANFEPQVE